MIISAFKNRFNYCNEDEACKLNKFKNSYLEEIKDGGSGWDGRERVTLVIGMSTGDCIRFLKKYKPNSLPDIVKENTELMDDLKMEEEEEAKPKTIIEQIKKDLYKARVNQETGKVKLLSFIYNTIISVGKDDKTKSPRDTTNQEAIQVLKKIISNNQLIINMIKDKTPGPFVTPIAAETENLLISKYLPKQMTTEELTETIRKIIKVTNVTNMKGMRLVIETLKVLHEGTFDNKMASKIVKELLS